MVICELCGGDIREGHGMRVRDHGYIHELRAECIAAAREQGRREGLEQAKKSCEFVRDFGDGFGSTGAEDCITRIEAALGKPNV